MTIDTTSIRSPLDLPIDEFMLRCKAAIHSRSITPDPVGGRYLHRREENNLIFRSMDGSETVVTPTPSVRPIMLLYAGPYGAGKTTFAAALPVVGLYANDCWIQADRCPSPESEFYYEICRPLIIGARASFTAEDFFCNDTYTDLMGIAHAQGYLVDCVFVTTDTGDICLECVEKRIQNGGLFRNPDGVRYVHHGSNLRCHEAFRFADRVRVVDNSGETPHLLVDMRNRTVLGFPAQGWTANRIAKLVLCGPGRISDELQGWINGLTCCIERGEPYTLPAGSSAYDRHKYREVGEMYV